MERESFKSRLGFILLSAGCAIGVGNVWRFPYITGQNGGGMFVLIYAFFLIALGIPVLTMEFAIGRKSRKSPVLAYQQIQKPGQKWHYHGKVALLGNYVLMMFYTVITGWMVSYFWKYLTGQMATITTAEAAGNVFGTMMSSPGPMVFWMAVVVVLGFAVCSLGLQKGVEKISKTMMILLLVLIVVLAAHSFTLEGAAEGLKFYLYPDINKMKEVGIFTVITQAMNQAFFTLSLGMGGMLIFGSYMGNEKTLLGESITVTLLDTFVAFTAGLIIFPACFTFGVEASTGPSLIFAALPNVFGNMALGQVWGTLFFLFMTFASFSTVIGVFENIIACDMELFNVSRKKLAVINTVIIILCSIPCALGFNVWAGFQPLGAGTCVLDLEDFIVSNMILPIGSLIITLFCTTKYGWGFENYIEEANKGEGVKIPMWLKPYFKYVLPCLVLFLIVQSLVLFFL